ncbi:MAG: NADH-quinone oxidoreductase subunit J [SAR324 cluster bacterium]|nr:NADH-quinone oxidoreductase subunit J [SAR324 cluster bacterium]
MWNEAIHSLVFYFLAGLSILTAIAVVGSQRILRAALALAGVLICNAGFYVLLDFEFLAGVQVLVYVGGIVILVVFAIMLTSSVELVENHPSSHRKWIGALAASFFFLVTSSAFLSSDFPVDRNALRSIADVKLLGRKLLDYGAEGYVLPFEIISLLLLSVMIGGIIVARKAPQSEKKK